MMPNACSTTLLVVCLVAPTAIFTFLLTRIKFRPGMYAGSFVRGIIGILLMLYMSAFLIFMIGRLLCARSAMVGS
jgi:hypothetical protein